MAQQVRNTPLFQRMWFGSKFRVFILFCLVINELSALTETGWETTSTLSPKDSTCGCSYRPEQVLVADEEPHDIRGLLRVTFLGAVGQPAGDGLVEEEVGSHDGGHSPQVHPVPLLSGNHLTEKLQEGLKETHVQTRENLESFICIYIYM